MPRTGFVNFAGFTQPRHECSSVTLRGCGGLHPRFASLFSNEELKRNISGAVDATPLRPGPPALLMTRK